MVVNKSTLTRGRHLTINYLKLIFKKSKLMVILTFALSLFIVIKYQMWWQSLRFLDQGGDSTIKPYMTTM